MTTTRTRDRAARPTAGRRPVAEGLTAFLNTTLAVAACAVLALPLLADDQADGNLPTEGPPAATSPDRIMATRPDARPRWTADVAHRFPGCTSVATFKRQHPGTVPARAIVVRLDGTVHPMTTDETFARAATRTRADDVWTIGLCAR